MQYVISKSQHPKEIFQFLDNVFEIYEIRGIVGKYNGLKFEIRTKETCHATPHVHAEYGEFEISIEIETSKILAGNLPNKNKRLAIEWVLKNKQKLLKDWNNIAISILSNMTKSKLLK